MREQDDREMVLVEGHRKLRVVPAQAEQPPLTIGDSPSDYCLAKTKSLKKGMFKGKLGKITVSAVQPNAIMLPSPSSGTTSAPTTMAALSLRFDPSSTTSQPPRLGGLTTKIKASTFFAVRPSEYFPSHTTMVAHFETMKGLYDTSVSLNSRCVEAVSWTKHKPAPAYTRRNSDSSTSTSSDSDDQLVADPKENTIYYTATILVPISLPSTKTWIPSFQSCIASRFYTVDMCLSIHTPGTGVPATTVTLHIPIQIAAVGNQTERTALTPAEAAAELADAEEFLRPRVIEVPSAEHIGNSVLAPSASELPPSYEAFASSRAQVVAPGRG